MTFDSTDFDTMRKWLHSLPGSLAIKRARIKLFDRYCYCEDYEKIYEFIIDMGGQIR